GQGFMKFKLICVLALTLSLIFSQAQAQTPRPGYFTLDFDNVELKDLIKTMSDITGKNFIIDAKVKGKVTTYSPKQIPVRKAYQVLLSILEVEGYTAIESNNMVKILPLKDAVRRGVKVHYDSAGAGSNGGGEIVTRVIPLRYADANEVRKVIKPLVSESTSLVVHASTNTLILTGLPSSLNHLEQIITRLDVEQEKQEIHIYHVKNIKAKPLEEVLQRLLLPTGAQTQTTRTTAVLQKGHENFSVVADEETNSLLITAGPQEFQQIEKIVQQLDVKQQQVLVDVLIAEVSLDHTSAFGIEWQASKKVGDDHHVVAGTDFGIRNDLLLGGLSGLSLGLLKGDISNVKGILVASVGEDNFNILSTPQLLTIDNHQAEIKVGNQVPFLVNSRLTDQETLVRSFNYQDVGLKLTVTPHINQNKYITLDLYQEVRSLSSATVFDAPLVSVRQIQTQVTVEDRKTVVVGGLIQNDRIENIKKVPVLGDIPLLGLAFKRKSVENKKSNLLVFITPYLITDSEVLEKISKERKQSLQEFQNKK
ncbi:MAG: secretin N-terminal domain-containing protein, partial [bacterium]